MSRAACCWASFCCVAAHCSKRRRSLRQLFVLLGQLAAGRFEFLLLRVQFGVGQSIVLGQLAANPSQGLNQGGRRGGAGKLDPKLFGRQADFQRLAVQAVQFAAELFQGRPAAIHVLGAARPPPGAAPPRRPAPAGVRPRERSRRKWSSWSMSRCRAASCSCRFCNSARSSCKRASACRTCCCCASNSSAACRSDCWRAVCSALGSAACCCNSAIRSLSQSRAPRRSLSNWALRAFSSASR